MLQPWAEISERLRRFRISFPTRDLVLSETCFVSFAAFCGLSEGKFAGPTLFMLDGGSHFQQPIKHLGAFSTACG
jgi:hypothetical protein